MKLMLILLLLCIQHSIANTYYVKSLGGTGSGLDDENAWSFQKLNSSSLSVGDQVLLKRDDVFTGTLNISANGVSFDSYGTGSNPVITGFIQLTSWTLYNNNIYYVNLDVPSLNIVTIDGSVKAMGRYPNAGYLTYTSHSGNTSITGSSVNSIKFDPTRAEVVIRKYRWILDRHLIKSRNSETLNFSVSNGFGNNGIYSPVDGNGYFIQGSLGTLDQDGEWFYDANVKRLYVYFSGDPALRVVKASTSIQNVYINYYHDLSFNNIKFEGGNLYGCYNIGTSNISYNNCNFNQQGGDAIWASHITNLIIKGGSFSDVLNNSIYGEQNVNGTVIYSVAIKNSGVIAGAAKSGDDTQQGICIHGNNTKIEMCSVENSGYNAIRFDGDGALINKNFVDKFCTIKDDGGGIYTYIGRNAVIKNNIVLNAIGAFAGAESYYFEPFGKAAGIYLDNGTSDHSSKVENNVIANGQWGGIFLNSNGKNQVKNNLVYNTLYQLYISDYTNIRNLSITGNQFIAKTASQLCLRIELGNDDDLAAIGKLDSNIYARPIDDSLTFSIYNNYSGGGSVKMINLLTWKSLYNQDAVSKKSILTISNIDRLKFIYNKKTSKALFPLDCFYLDFKNNIYNSNITIPSHSGSVLIKTDTVKPTIIAN